MAFLICICFMYAGGRLRESDVDSRLASRFRSVSQDSWRLLWVNSRRIGGVIVRWIGIRELSGGNSFASPWNSNRQHTDSSQLMAVDSSTLKVLLGDSLARPIVTNWQLGRRPLWRCLPSGTRVIGANRQLSGLTSRSLLSVYRESSGYKQEFRTGSPRFVLISFEQKRHKHCWL